jgi:BON domain-containing protein
MRRASTTLGFVSGLGAGVALMYFCDPDRGARRRALVRDKFIHWSHRLNDASRATTRDLGHRLQGAAARVRRSWEEQLAPDEILVERVRSRVGRVITHPRAIDVMACDGVVTLCGPLSTRESEAAVAAVASTPGVVEVVNRLDPDGAANAVPVPMLS